MAAKSMASFSECLRLREPEIYPSFLPEDPEKTLRIFSRNQNRIFLCAVNGDLGRRSLAYDYAAKREEDRLLRSLGTKRGPAPEVNRAFTEIRNSLWQDRTEMASRINENRSVEARTASLRFDFSHQASAWGGGMAGFLVGGGAAYLLRINPMLGLATGLLGAVLGVLTGDRLAEKLAYEQALQDQGGLLPLWREGSEEAPLPHEVFDRLAARDETLQRSP